MKKDGQNRSQKYEVQPLKILLLSLSETPLPIAWESNCCIFRLKAHDVIKTPAIKCVLRLRIVKVSDFNVYGSVWLSGQHSRFWPPQIPCEAGSGIADGNNFSPLRSKRCSRSASVGDISSKFCSEAGVLAITTFCKVTILLMMMEIFANHCEFRGHCVYWIDWFKAGLGVGGSCLCAN